MDDVKFSVIIPSLNTEKYIGKCIESVVKQEYTNLEIIVVDEVGNGRTYEILKSYKKKYPNIIKLIKTNEHGVSCARNIGIKCASGDYICFLDSDDYLMGNLFKFVNSILRTNDIDCFVGTFESFSDVKDLKPLQCRPIDEEYINNKAPEEVLNYFYDLRLIQTVWRFVIKASIIKQNNLYFTPHIIHEDEEWVAKTLIKCNSFYLIPFIHYAYRKRKNSIMAKKNYEHFYGMFRVGINLLEEVEKAQEEYMAIFMLRTIYKMCEMCYYGVKELANPDN